MYHAFPTPQICFTLHAHIGHSPFPAGGCGSADHLLVAYSTPKLAVRWTKLHMLSCYISSTDVLEIN